MIVSAATVLSVARLLMAAFLPLAGKWAVAQR